MRKPRIDIIAEAKRKYADGNRTKTEDEKLSIHEREVFDRCIAAAATEIYKPLKDKQKSA